MVPTAKVSPGLWVDVNVSTLQLSAAVGAVQVTAAEQLPVSLDCEMSAGVPEMVGFSLSVTVTLKLDVTEFPAASVAV